MRRDAKPAKSKVAKPPIARKSRKSEGSRVDGLEKRLAEAQKRASQLLDALAFAAEKHRMQRRKDAEASP